MTRLPAIVNRAVYRSLARLSNNGSQVEVFPWKTLQATQSDFFLPLLVAKERAAANAMLVLRRPFAFGVDSLSGEDTDASENDVDWTDPFVVMRHASMLADALRPRSLPPEMPALVENSPCLPGERRRFVLESPAEQLLYERSEHEGTRRFVHLSERPGRSPDAEHIEGASAALEAVGSVLTVLDARAMPFGGIVIDCVAGPRCRIISRRVERVDDGTANRYDYLPVQSAIAHIVPDQKRAKRLLHVETRMIADTPTCSRRAHAAVDELRSELAARLLHCKGPALLAETKLVPPLLCPERLSLFLCALLVHPDDKQRRLATLYTRHTLQRLEFCESAMDRAGWPRLREGDEIAWGSANDAAARAAAAGEQGGSMAMAAA